MKKNSYVFILILSGCISGHASWTYIQDDMVGTKLDRHYWPPLCESNCLSSLWSAAADNKNKFDDVVIDGVNTRYYVTWLPGCQYSVLVDPGKIILSWRYEIASDDKCIVW